MGVACSSTRDRGVALPVSLPVTKMRGVSSDAPKSTGGRRRALLVGIDYVDTSFPLWGCVNDIENQKRALMDNFGFVETDFLVLSDGAAYLTPVRPTKARIEAGVEWLLEGAAPGDLLFFAYSGHGTLVDTDDPVNSHEAICPLDCIDGKWPQALILDTEIHATFYDRLPSGVRCVCIFDCCNSGRIAELPIVKSLGTNVDGPPRNRFLAPPPGAYDSASHVLLAALPSPVGIMPTPDTNKKLWVYSGSQNDQTSADTYVEGTWQGAFTFSLLKALADNKWNLSYLELLNRAKFILDDRMYTQIPALGTSESEYLQYFYLSMTDVQLRTSYRCW